MVPSIAIPVAHRVIVLRLAKTVPPRNKEVVREFDGVAIMGPAPADAVCCRQRSSRELC